ncbi:MAG: type II toxin-antitoxin system HicA family toxin [Nitrosopumilus sp.]|nr:type II toxin-antitoxin system HicA family toxin [Nitrosopumilus sp.]MDF2427593.1 type II toxin-antitoxin system HicA family toxin [Nitrosopumilus sp.]MDF2428237.1 type II toxin-antitoxin system HicA family toxin [Nitrosopumilus sp.]
MSLPVIGYREIFKALRKKGFYSTRQTGSHVIVENGNGLWTSVPRKKELGKGLILQIISDCGLTKKEFLELL